MQKSCLISFGFKIETIMLLLFFEVVQYGFHNFTSYKSALAYRTKKVLFYNKNIIL